MRAKTRRKNAFLRRVLRHAIYLPLGVLAVLIVQTTADAERLMRLAAEMQSLDGAARMAWASLLERLSFTWYTGASEMAEAYAAILADAARSEQRAYWLSGITLALIAGQCALICSARPIADDQLAWHLNLLAIPVLAIGLCAPMLTVTAFAQVPVLGEVIVKYDTKSIVSTVLGLLASKNIVLALIIAGFSIAVPIVKLAVVAVSLSGRFGALRAASARWLKNLGKWSMADVFVVAVLVAFLAFETDVHSAAAVGLGLYFFTLYCLLSLIAGQLVQRIDDE